jgi:hypothetical protein
MTDNLPAVIAHEAMVTRSEISVDDVVAQRDKIKQVMQRVMQDGSHYGRIPGINKPTLLKAGAEVLTTTFRLAPSYQSERAFYDSGHLTVSSKCILTHAPSGLVLGEGEGICSTRESKYAWRNAERFCPNCGVAAIIKGKAQYGGGWLCWKKKDGCGQKFEDGDPAIESQNAGKIENPDLPDTWNTVQKMANKRALVAAVLNCTAASDIFTQDVEDGQPAPDDDLPETLRADPSLPGLDQLSAELLAMFERWHELEPDFNVEAATQEMAKKSSGSDTDFRTWLNNQIQGFAGMIVNREGEPA